MNKPKPTVLKLLDGNPGKRPLNRNEPVPDDEIPVCPDWLEQEAKNEWDRIVPELHKLRLLTKIDMTALIGYCQSWARYVEAEKYLSEHDSIMITESGYMQQVPQVGIALKYLKSCQSFMTEFGLTPSSRSKINLPGEDPKDEMEKLLKAGRR